VCTKKEEKLGRPNFSFGYRTDFSMKKVKEPKGCYFFLNERKLLFSFFPLFVEEKDVASLFLYKRKVWVFRSVCEFGEMGEKEKPLGKTIGRERLF